MGENKIHVGLYGGKSILYKKEVPLRAEIIYCIELPMTKVTGFLLHRKEQPLFSIS